VRYAVIDGHQQLRDAASARVIKAMPQYTIPVAR
jgi:hypothetical protein